LPITVHPEYRQAESEWEQGSIHRLRTRGWTFFPEQPAESDPLLAIAPPPEPAPGPVLIPGDGEPSWLGSAFRHLLHRTRSSV
jgi:hypothetical protein